MKRPLLWLSLIAWQIPSQAGEVLGHISDESAPVVAEPAVPVDNGRRIIYRVICSPEGEALPDCEKPFHDAESPNQPEPSPDMEEPEAAEEAAPLEQVAPPPKPKQTKKATAGKQKAVKKPAKKDAAKKTAVKKK